ncbi:hypothetical protein FB45DRAFT_328335 [Roridomyces roridus]|uniref:F-box domain-containing protein n=1 Tax=Roridomyces roridus TaxID=1738132 RepID=A0AAD7B617_9AGAR|nr:hypothetical protein FB45DRAFT_328335 [Roridomyces roridus]
MGIISAHDAWKALVLSTATMNAPIETLPFEIISQIMLLALPAPESRTLRMILSLVKVCPRWRGIASETPELWALPLPRMNDRVTKEVASSLTANLLRLSAPYPFPVSIQNVIPKGDILAPLSAVRDASQRWESLQIHSSYSGEGEAELLDHIPAGKFDSLKKIDLRLVDVNLHRSPNFRVFESAPQLCEVKIVMRDAFHIPPMPWTRLTRLSLTCASPQACLDAVMHCESIVEARFVTRQWMSEVVFSKVATLRYLKTLEIEMAVGSQGEDLGPFLRGLRLPSLETLKLSMDYSNAGDGTFTWNLLPELEFFLSHSQKIEHLTLDQTVFSDDMPAILALTPCLTHLVFADGETAKQDVLFKALDGHELVPKLQSLELKDLFFESTESVLWSMIKTRCYPRAPEGQKEPVPQRLKRLNLEWSEKLVNPYDPRTIPEKQFSHEFRDALWTYEKQGLDFSGIRIHMPELEKKRRVISELQHNEQAIRRGTWRWAMPNYYYNYVE